MTGLGALAGAMMAVAFTKYDPAVPPPYVILFVVGFVMFVVTSINEKERDSK